MNCRMYLGADCDTDYQLLMTMLKVRLAKRQRQHSIPPLNLEVKEEKAVQFAAKVTNRFTALDEVTTEDLWKGTETVLANLRILLYKACEHQLPALYVLCGIQEGI